MRRWRWCRTGRLGGRNASLRLVAQQDARGVPACGGGADYICRCVQLLMNLQLQSSALLPLAGSRAWSWGPARHPAGMAACRHAALRRHAHHLAPPRRHPSHSSQPHTPHRSGGLAAGCPCNDQGQGGHTATVRRQSPSVVLQLQRSVAPAAAAATPASLHQTAVPPTVTARGPPGSAAAAAAPCPPPSA